MPPAQKPIGKEPTKNVYWEYNDLCKCFGGPANSGMNARSVWEPTLAQHALKVADFREIGQGSLEVPVEDLPIQV